MLPLLKGTIAIPAFRGLRLITFKGLGSRTPAGAWLTPPPPSLFKVLDRLHFLTSVIGDQRVWVGLSGVVLVVRLTHAVM